jgi:hypothetical protein
MSDMILSPDSIMQAARRPETENVPVPDWGGFVTVKGFTRAELKALRKRCTTTTTQNGQKVDDTDGDQIEKLMFLEGLVEPKLTQDHWNELQNRAAGGIETVLRAITKASGLSKEEAEELRKSVPAEAGDVVRALPDESAGVA